jgi:hypothetical protein
MRQRLWRICLAVLLAPSVASATSGEPVVNCYAISTPATSYASWTPLAGASTPAEAVPSWCFVEGADAYLDYYCVLDAGYDGGGLTITLAWRSTGTTNNVFWQAALRDIPDDAEDLDTTAFTYDFNSVTAAVPSAAGEVVYDAITFANGADMDSTPAGDHFILRIFRDQDNAADTSTATACIVGLTGKES